MLCYTILAPSQMVSWGFFYSNGSTEETLAAHPLAKRGSVTTSVLVGAGHYFQESCAGTQFMRAQMERDVGLAPGRNPYVLLPLRNTSLIGGAD